MTINILYFVSQKVAILYSHIYVKINSQTNQSFLSYNFIYDFQF